MSRWLAYTFVAVGIVTLPAVTTAQPAKPRFLIIVDTSGSMSLDTSASGVETHGDGSSRHPGCDLDDDSLYNDSRLFQAKQALIDTITAFGQAEFALARYRGVDVKKVCTSDGDCTGDASLVSRFTAIGSGDRMDNLECITPTHTTDGSKYCAVNKRWGCNSGWYNYMGGNGTPTCYDECTSGAGCERCANPDSDPFDLYTKGMECSNDSCQYPNCVGADVIVPFPPSGASNFSDLLMWMDGAEDYPQGNNKELRANGGTPLAGSLSAAYHWLTDSTRMDIGTFPGLLSTQAGSSDPQKNCRSYNVILITDGREGCAADGNAATAAAALLGQDVKTYVIGFQVNDSTLNGIASAGGTTTALTANNRAQLTARLGDIIASSIPKPACDCNSACDDEAIAFPEKGGECSVGVGRCRRKGVWACNAAETGTICSSTPASTCPGTALSPGTPGGDPCTRDASCPAYLTDAECADVDCDGDIDEIAQCTCAAKPELCNGLDDNCNQIIDDIAPSTCGLGIGECPLGTRACVANQQGGKEIICVGSKDPLPEVCDGKDNNCDGVSDGFSEACYPPAFLGCSQDLVSKVWTCLGACQTGLSICPVSTNPNNQFGACSGAVTPRSEVPCDGIDNDCDGQTDEGFGIGDPCYGGGSGCNLGTGQCVGACRIGKLECTSGAVICVNDLGPSEELCDGVDNDCDGNTDIGLGACGPALGECQAGQYRCQGNQRICDQPFGPKTETCNGKDDDCDGTIDNNLSEPEFQSDTPCSVNQGLCRAGVLRCVGGQPFCQGGIQAQTEVCNNVDDDCDGCTDCDPVCLAQLGKTCPIPGSGQACGLAVGICTPGALLCVGGSTQCVGANGPKTELCDGLDNDCNGFTDEADPALGESCYPGGATGCDAGGGACTGECALGVNICQASAGGAALSCANPVTPVSEICDRKDNDCDGQTDEEFDVGAACNNGASGKCFAEGMKICNARGDGTTCSVTPPPISDEICDGLDNDCDGKIDLEDEDKPLPGVGLPCGSNVGECRIGTQKCVMGKLVCDAVEPTPEVCDGKDNDCDGSIDEDLTAPGEMCAPPGLASGAPVVGECRAGKFVCARGQSGVWGWQCREATGPQPELCDGKDNDCDGMVDDAAMCPPDFQCVMGECVPRCGDSEFPCPADRKCRDGYCIRNPCVNVSCAPGNICDDEGKCIDLCDDKNCPMGSQCVGGTCIDCHVTGCPAGTICTVHTCESDPCANVSCPSGQYCRNGQCANDCSNVTCGAGQLCRNGVCQGDLCSNTLCGNAEFCDPTNGQCRSNPCELRACMPGTRCIPTTGQCEDDPCLRIQCPAGTQCAVYLDGHAECLKPPAAPGPSTPQVKGITSTGGGLTSCACHLGAAPPDGRTGERQGSWLLLTFLLMAGGERRRRRRRRESRQGGRP